MSLYIQGAIPLRHLFIINPKAGKRDQTSRVMQMADGLRQRHGLDCACLLTQSAGHATVLARKAAESGEAVRVYACGGDGTIHEVANGLAGFDNAAMTCIPTGTGNDFLKNFGEDMARFADAENLWDGPVFPLDLIDCNGRCCVTIACAGIDARVAADVHQYSGYPFLTGKGSYAAALAVNFLIKGINRRWTLVVDGVPYPGDYTLVAMCNGRYYGGGFSPIPDARMDDRRLDTIIVTASRRLAFARHVGAYSSGNWEQVPRYMRVIRGSDIVIRPQDGDIAVCLDGEIFRCREVSLRLSDKRLNFFGPAGCDCNRTAR